MRSAKETKVSLAVLKKELEHEKPDITAPLQNLFDDCFNFVCLNMDNVK